MMVLAICPHSVSQVGISDSIAEANALNKERIIEIIGDNYPCLVSEYGGKRIGLFGSYAKGRQTEEGDIDILADFEGPLGFDLWDLKNDYVKLFLKRKRWRRWPGPIEATFCL
jgi:predicted nucleotidyltransferase